MKYIIVFSFYVIAFAMAQSHMHIYKSTHQNGRRGLLGEMPLTNEDNFQYYGNFSLGTPNQTGAFQNQFIVLQVSLILDTTEDQTWVSSRTYNSSQSTTANISRTTGNITYGGGYVIGYQGTEVFGQKELFLQNVTISLLFASSVVNLPTLVQDGVLGLTNNKNYKNFVEQAATAKYLNDSVFAFNVNNMFSASDFYAGTPSFPARLSLTWINCTSTTVWQIPISTMSIGTTSFPLTTGTAILDTSISMLTIPQTSFSNFLTAVSTLCQSQASGDYYICDCASYTGFPIIYFTSGANTLRVGPKQYLDPLGTGEFCLLAIYPITTEALTFGDAFLKSYFIAFDKTNNKIAPNKPNK